nr:MAG TPA: Head Tail Connector Protein [Caudoviricetes sp.]
MISRDSLPDGLLSDVKNYLNITWDDEATDQKISGLIASGMIYLNLKYGGEADYTKDGMPRTLLMEYVRYARDSALDVFENNYQAMLLGMQNERLVSVYGVEGAISAE